MVESHQLALFMLATITLNITPGPDLLYVATRSLHQGKMAGLVSALGISVGSIGHCLMAAFGVSAILMYSAVAFQIVKYLGAAYLIYLGIKTFRKKSALATSSVNTNDSLRKIFTQGVITNLLNPKVALFFLAFLPQFVSPENGNVTLQILFLGALFNISGTTVCCLVALFFGYLGSSLIKYPGFVRAQRWFTGTVFLALGTKLALSDRR